MADIAVGGYMFSVKAGGAPEDIYCCRPYTGLGAALMFARAWRVSNPKNAQIPLAVFQEMSKKNRQVVTVLWY